jgi:glycine/D-amino acid oxidase-like deaminating enzyme
LSFLDFILRPDRRRLRDCLRSDRGDATEPPVRAILGRVRDRVWVAAGLSGRGFMLASAVGRIIAESLVEGREDVAVGVLDAERFVEGRLLPEPQIV